MGGHLVGGHEWVGETLSNWIQLVFATPVVLWAGWPFFVRGRQSLVTRNLNMFTLIAMGVGVSYVYSLVATIAPRIFPATFRGHDGAVAVYFEAATVITVLVLLGQVLELRAREATSGAIKALLDLAPKTAHRVNESGADLRSPWIASPLATSCACDQAEGAGGRRHDRRPILARRIDGDRRIMPVSKEAGTKVIAGTLNQSGSFILQAEKVGRDTLLSQIVQMVAQAQRSRAPIQRLADQVAGWFVPTVIVVALIAFGAWTLFGPEPRVAFGLAAGVSVLIVACPCALGLATPMSIMVGVGRGAQAGVLIKNAEALEHALADAIVRAAKERNLSFRDVQDFDAPTGKGVTGNVEGKAVLLGNANFLKSSGIETQVLEQPAEKLRGDGATVINVALDGKLAGVLAIADPVKPSTPDALKALRAEGIKVVMLTGDNQTTANTIAKQLGIVDVEAEVLPDQKNAVVSKLKKMGRVVAMAGDGVNDAPALAAAEVGIAMGTGTDVAIESASVTLLKGDLGGIVRARRLSQATMGNIRQNLFFAFIYNAAGIPIAAGILYPTFGVLLSPIIAAAAMALSSLSVVGNALRLRSARI